MEYTQEQLDQMKADWVKEATTGLYSEDDFQRKLTAEVDRRVDTGIQKGLDTQRKKWEEEFSKKAQMSAEELAQQKLQEQLGELSTKEKEIAKRANLLQAKEALADAKIPKSQYEKLLNSLVSEDVDSTMSNVQSFIEVYNETKTEIETQIKSAMSNVPAPTTGTNAPPLTKDDFNKLSYTAKMELKKENPDLFSKLMQ
jgi:hypothetical protein